MKSVILGAIALVALSLPAFAQNEPKAQDEPKPISVDQAKAIIAKVKDDKAKMKTYCDIQGLYAQADAAGEKKDDEAAEKLLDGADKKVGELGDDFQKVLDLSASLDPDSAEAKDLDKAMTELDGSCK